LRAVSRSDQPYADLLAASCWWRRVAAGARPSPTTACVAPIYKGQRSQQATPWATAASLPRPLDGTILVTVHPEHVARGALETIALVVAVGSDPAATLRAFCGALGEDLPEIRDGQIERGLAYLWERRERRERRLSRVRINEPRQHLRRHTRKYAEGELGEDRSFYFRGPDGGLNLRAQNLRLFLQIAAGVDDATWLHHLRAGDYSRWLAVSIKDPELASEVAVIEENEALNAGESRVRVKEAIDRCYTGAI
jgi:hypothetical protein